MLTRGLVEAAAARAYHQAIEGQLYRFPAVDPAAFRAAVREAFGS
jgi:hypothetical protein